MTEPIDPDEAASITSEALLTISDLQVAFDTDQGPVKVVDGVSFQISKGEILGLVGESGCGKSVTCFSILRLLASPPPGTSVDPFCWRNRDLLRFSEKEMRQVRGNAVSIIFQEPMTSLNPIMKIGSQVSEALREHRKVSRAEARNAAVSMLKRVGLPDADSRFDDYPHQLSGGMKQRVMIAMALVCRPQLLIADEPTTALDVTIQAQILGLLRELQREFGMSILLITHDLGVVAETCNRVAVMYAGKIVESSSTEDLFNKPFHPYTRGLFRSLPANNELGRPLHVIPGSVPNPSDLPSGCRFRTRCEFARERCQLEPLLREVTAGHFAACHFSEEIALHADQHQAEPALPK